MRNMCSVTTRRSGRPDALAGAATLLCAAMALAGAPALAEDAHAHHDHHAMAEGQTANATDEHAAHRAMMAAPSYQVTEAEYQVPDLVLQDQQGRPVRLAEIFSGERPVAVNFIFTSCTTICPVMTATMIQLQRELADDAVKPLFVSISIDPDYDTAEQLGAYARRFGADWTFLTGSRSDVLEVLQSFSAWRGNKNNHAAITLFRSAGKARWTRVEGLASARQLAEVWNDSLG